MPNKFFDRNWWKDFVVAILATTVSIVLTFGTGKLVEWNNQKKERKLTALMVMSSIESFARTLDESATNWDRMDSIAVWLLRLPIDEVARVGACFSYMNWIEEEINKESIDANLDFARKLDSLLNHR